MSEAGQVVLIDAYQGENAENRDYCGEQREEPVVGKAASRKRDPIADELLRRVFESRSSSIQLEPCGAVHTFAVRHSGPPELYIAGSRYDSL